MRCPYWKRIPMKGFRRLKKIAAPPPIKFPPTALVEYLDEVVNVEDLNIKTYNREEESDMEDTGFQYDLTATYEVNYSDMSDGYDDYDTYKIKLKLESDYPDFIEQPELELDLTMHNKGKLESLLKLINTVFYLGKNNSENYLIIDGKCIETSDLEI
jgi:hypothetical protein